jgi:hypothetical protein
MTLSVRAFNFFLSEVKTVTKVVRSLVSFSATAVSKLNMIFARAEDNIRRHTSAYVSIRQQATAYVRIRVLCQRTINRPPTTSYNHFFHFFFTKPATHCMDFF